MIAMEKYFYHEINSPIGKLSLVSDETHLMACEVSDHLQSHIYAGYDKFIHDASSPIKQAISELEAYFSGQKIEFSTPIKLNGTDFQLRAWQVLQNNIPYGSTISYKEQADKVGKITAHRAVANANARNKFLIMIPCHRVINSDGKLGGFSAGISMKQWLLDFEQKNL